LLISFMCSSSFILGYGGWSLLHNFSFLFLFVGTRNPSSNQFCLPSTNKFSPMLERGTSTCTLSSHLH
jgi:hypothetical protein